MADSSSGTRFRRGLHARDGDAQVCDGRRERHGSERRYALRGRSCIVSSVRACHEKSHLLPVVGPVDRPDQGPTGRAAAARLYSRKSNCCRSVQIPGAMAATNNTFLFCYGSLQQGFSRSWMLQASLLRGRSTFWGSYRLREKRPLILRAPNFVPVRHGALIRSVERNARMSDHHLISFCCKQI